MDAFFNNRLVAFTSAALAVQPSIADFARLPELTSVSISPDGHYLALVGAVQGKRSVRVVDLADRARSPGVILSSDMDKAQLSWCKWANNTRLLCGYRGMIVDAGFVYVATRLVGIDADGKSMKLLVENSSGAGSQIQDEIIDWTPDDPETVLIVANESLLDTQAKMRMSSGGGGDFVGATNESDPAVFELNINTGRMKVVARSHDGVTGYMTDKAGKVRLSMGIKGTTYSYYARSDGETTWRRLAKMEAFSGDDSLRPLGMAEESNMAYAIGSSHDHDALWKIDLEDKKAPELIFEHPAVDVFPMLRQDGHLLGVYYETDRPFICYLDGRASSVADALKHALPDAFSRVVDATRDESVYVVSAVNDRDHGTFYLFDTKTGVLKNLGSSYSALDKEQLASMKSITYPASDGTSIPGYLTVPRGKRAEHLPLIVMPHGGPVARDSWEFDFLRLFLASRGYAVLQMNFRGSSGYGDKWLYDAHQDWGGLTYSDITDGTKWAITQGIADAKRICVVGWSFGGYAALLSATRNSDLYACSASIAGVSDLGDLLAQWRNFKHYEVSRLTITTDSAKRKLDSPVRHAADVAIPVWMIHGDHDAQANVSQSRDMASALKSAGKRFQYIELKGASHQLDRESDRVTLLTELEKFLNSNLGPSVFAPD